MGGIVFRGHRCAEFGVARRPARSVLGRAALAVVLVLAGAAVLAPSQADAAVALTVTTTADIAANAGDCGSTSTTVPSPLSLREATCIANNYGASQPVTINVSAGNYVLSSGELQLGKVSGSNITLAGAGAANTIIDGNLAGRVFDLDPNIVGGVTTTISGITITNGRDGSFGGGGVVGGSGTKTALDTLTISNSVISKNQVNSAAPNTSNKPGGGILYQGGVLNLANDTFDGNQSFSSGGSAVWYQAVGTATGQTLKVTGSTFSNNPTLESGASGTTGGALAVSAGAGGGTYTVTNSTFTGNSVSTSSAEAAAGGAIFQITGNLTVTGSTFTGNSVSGTNATGGSVLYTAGTATLHYNRIVGNTGSSGVMTNSGTGTTANVAENWWGSNSGPATTDTAGTGVTRSPYLVLAASASPSHVTGPNGTATLSASLQTDSAGAAVSATNLATPAFDGLPVSFSDPPGDATVTLATGTHTANLASGLASIDYHSNTTYGPTSDTAKLDNTSLTINFEVDAAPNITSPDTAAFTPGTPGTFTIKTTGYPVAAITESGAVPPGLTFQDNHDGTATISGTPTAGGTNPLNLTAANGISPNATQTLTITVGQPPAFTSSSNASFVIGVTDTFTVSTSGIPTAAISKSGALPAGVTFADNHDGTATIAGTPTGHGGSYPVTLTAANGVSPDATQNLAIQVNEAPAITTNPADQTVAPGTPVSFTAAASGVPTPTVQWERSTDGGASFTAIGGATTAIYSLTATAGDSGNEYRAVFSNGVDSAATTSAATLTVQSAPLITSADHTTFVVGQAGSFDVGTSGVPAAVVSVAGSQVPGWLTVQNHGDGTATFTGTPPAGSGGAYQFSVQATNGVDPAASQPFTLSVDDSPAITSADHTTFTVGTTGTFTVTTTAGYPATTTLTDSGATLPSGVTFQDNGDGTATLTGTPDPGTGGSYPITLTATATGGLAAPATQQFTLTVLAPPVITSPDHVTFTEGADQTFPITTTAGNPNTTTLTVSPGTLPHGLSFLDNGDGSATIAGTPQTGTQGVYPLTLTASNGVAPDATQPFTLTITAAPVITSPDHATFTAGTHATFTVTTTGLPRPTLSHTGTLPPGMTFADNNDGTATLTGTPTTGGSYTFTLTATNGITPDATQTFTATVQSPPTITSADHTTFAVGQAGSFTITTAAGVPDATTITAAGDLPSGVTFQDNGDGTATLIGTPAAGSGNQYPVTIQASNGVLPNATQSFLLTVLEVPGITSADHATFTVGQPGSLTVTTTAGFPRATTLTESGTLPSGVTFHDNGDGTAALTGTPDPGTASSYPITLTATNSTGHTDQAFTLDVQRQTQTITITSVPPSPALVGGSYPLTASSDSGLTVAYSIDSATTNSACSLTGATVSFDAAGDCVVDFEQAGNGTYAPAAPAQQDITVTTVGTAVSVTTSPASTVYGQDTTATAVVTAARGTPDGTVQFSVDGTNLGTPVAVSGGSASSGVLTGAGGVPLAPGAHTVSARFTPTDVVTYASADAGVSHVVDQAATTTTLAVHAHTLRAAVAAVAPGAGTPSGTVRFSVGGMSVGTAPLSHGVAVLTYTVPTGRANAVAAMYSGDQNFTASSASTTRRDPTITARLSSAHPRNAAGWFRAPVTVAFACTAEGAPLTGPCPAPVTLTQGAGRSVARTVTATDGGAATVVVSGINIDLTRPRVSVAGVRDGATYSGTAPLARCVATDRLSGVASCHLTKSVRGAHVTYRAAATDVAGNVSRTSLTVTVLGYYLAGAPFERHAFTVRTGRVYTFVVTGTARRPVYYDAAVYPKRPKTRDHAFHRAGHNRWTLGVFMQPNLRTHPYWNIGALVGGSMRIIKIRVR